MQASNEKENGVRRLVWLSRDLDNIVEKTREKIGLSRSSFIKNAILRYLEEISVISAEAHVNPVAVPKET